MSHPGRIFISDTAAGKAWLQPVRVIRGKTREDFKIVDARGAVVRRFKRWRYAYWAYNYLCQRIKQEPLDDDGAWRELCREGYERAAREHRSFKRTLKRASDRGKERRAQRKRERQTRAAKFWKRMGGKPGLPTV